ncbi:MAG: CDP-diacylglycerol--glycerol-3-phosphate 3-phosphatidyltransferase, partial [uncultured Nocardioidaceae bacterium]
ERTRGGASRGCSRVRPVARGPHDPEPAEHAAARPAAGLPVARVRRRRPRRRGRGAHGHRHQRLARRGARAQAGPGVVAGSGARPGGRPALHPRRGRRPGGQRRHPGVAGVRARSPRPRAVGPRPGAAHTRLQRAARALPRQGGHGRAPLRLPAAAARHRRLGLRGRRARPRLGVRGVGERHVLVGGRPLRLAGADPRRTGPARRRGHRV